MFPLRKGSQGNEVAQLHLHLANTFEAEIPTKEAQQRLFGDGTATLVQKHMGVAQVSKADFKRITEANKIPLTPEQRQARQERVSGYVNTGANLLGQILGYKTAREQAKAAQSNAQNPNFQPSYFPPPPPQQMGVMPAWLKVVIGLLLLGIVIAIVVSLSSKKDAPAEKSE